MRNSVQASGKQLLKTAESSSLSALSLVQTISDFCAEPASVSVSGEVAASWCPRGSFPPIPPQEAVRRFNFALRLFFPAADRLVRADWLCNRCEPSEGIRLLSFDDREKFALNLFRDGTASAYADGDAIY